MKKLSFGILFALAALALTQPAMADTCSFQGSCLGFSRWCDFVASGSCTNGATPTFSWTCNDPTTNYTGNPITHHFNAVAASTCSLTCSCAGNPSTTTTLSRPVCFSIGVPGCIQPDRGYN